MLQILRLPLKQVSAKQSARAAASAAPVAAVKVSAGTSRCRVVMSDDDDFEPVPAEHKRKKVICDSYDGETTDGDDPAPSLDVTLRKL